MTKETTQERVFIRSDEAWWTGLDAPAASIIKWLDSRLALTQPRDVAAVSVLARVAEAVLGEILDRRWVITRQLPIDSPNIGPLALELADLTVRYQVFRTALLDACSSLDLDIEEVAPRFEKARRRI